MAGYETVDERAERCEEEILDNLVRLAESSEGTAGERLRAALKCVDGLDGFRQALAAERYLYGEPLHAVYSRRESNKAAEVRAYRQAVRILQRAQLRIIRDVRRISDSLTAPKSPAGSARY